MRLVGAPEPDGSVLLASARGKAPGVYHPGAAQLPALARVGILCDTLHGDPEVGIDLEKGLDHAAELITTLGFTPVIDTQHATVSPYFERWAGSVEARVRHFIRLIEELEVDAVFPLFGKGGYHAVVDALAASGYRPRRPVALIGGFSHHSDWSLFGQSEAGRGFFSHLISTTQCAYWKMLPAANVDNLHSVLHCAEAVEYTGLLGLNPAAVNGGVLEGALVGGNLSAVLRNLRKPWCPDYGGKIVVCEDYDNAPHEVHFRATEFVRTLEQAGARAAIFGAMLPQKRATLARQSPERRKLEAARDNAEIAAILREAASGVSIPVFAHAGICSHGAMNYPLGFGGFARVSVSRDGSASLYNRLEVL